VIDPAPDVEHPALIAHWEDLKANGERAVEVAGSLTPSQLWQRPRPKRWSVGECLDHLVLAGDSYLEVLDEAITGAARAENASTTGEPRPNVLERILLHGLEPPARIRIPAPARIRPRRPHSAVEPASTENDDPADPRARFQEKRQDYARRLEAAEGLDLEGVKVRSPFVRWIHISLDTAFRIVSGHERRHLAQAERALEGH
jgi:hypothetical protein